MRVLVALAVVAACRPPGYGKQLPPDASATIDDAALVADAGTDGRPATCEHAFRLDGHATSSSVWLTGEFVSWAANPQAGAVQLTLGLDGAWTGSYTFEPGEHLYKLIIDSNQWIADPTNPDSVDDGFGGKNSVYECVPP